MGLDRPRRRPRRPRRRPRRARRRPRRPDAGPTGCNGNTECPVGQFCDTQLHTCTFECRTSDDCGGGTCNSLGQCLAATGDSGGCCSTGATTTGGMLGALGLAGAVGLLLTRRRRKA